MAFDTGTFLSVLGTVAAFGMFCSPIPTMRRILKLRSVELYSEDPFLLTMINCGAWTLYGLITPDRTAPLVTNLIGLVFQTVYIIIFALNNPPNPSRFRVKVISTLSVLVVFTCFVLFGLPSMWPAVGLSPSDDADHDFQPDQTSFIGIVSDGFNILMYFGPLTIVGTVLRTRSVKYMPLAITVGTFFCSCSWLAYGLYMKDIYVLIPNGLGVFLCVIQLMVLWHFWNTDESVSDRIKEQQERHNAGGEGEIIRGMGVNGDFEELLIPAGGKGMKGV